MNIHGVYIGANIRKLAQIRIEIGRIMQAVGNERRCAVVFLILHEGVLSFFNGLGK